MTHQFPIAKAIVAKLVRSGYIAYFAGGWVRDFIMGHPSDDIDIATNATPSQIMDLFPQTILVGLAFGVVIVLVDGHQFEVATFRKDLDYQDGRRPEKIELSTPQEDALRRDFTINGMFYDPLEEIVHDYVNGREDIQKGIIRTIGNPHDRFFEDRLRMLRAFRFSARFAFAIEAETQEAIRENAEQFFPSVAMERVWQEFTKMAAYPRFDQALVEMHRLTLLDVIFPEIAKMHLHEMRQILSDLSFFPEGCPTILYLMEMFRSFPLTEKIEIAKRIKSTNKDCRLLEFVDHLDQTFLQEEKDQMINLHQWAILFANPDWKVGLGVLAARYERNNRDHFFNRFLERFKRLEPHIQRIREGKPLVTAALLQEKGILPGREMGVLLKEAEKIAVDQECCNSTQVLAILFHHPLWNKKEGG